MLKIITKISITVLNSILFLLLSLNANGQVSTISKTSNENSSDFDIHFLKHKIITKPETTVFNPLIIKNKTSKTATISLNITVPYGWLLINQNDMQVVIKAQDSVIIPVRFALAKNVKGEIGYAVVANLLNEKGQNITSEYCFIQVPKISNLKISKISRFEYIDKKTETAKFFISFSNKGNTDELITLELNLPDEVNMIGAVNNYYNVAISIPSNTDTTFRFSATKKPFTEMATNKLYKINLKASNRDYSFQQFIWLKNIDFEFRNEIPENYKTFIVELTAQNLFSAEKTSYRLFLDGNYLLKHNRGIEYYYLGSLDNNQTSVNNSRMFVTYNDNNKFKLTLGDLTSSPGLTNYGRGIQTQYSDKYFGAEAFYSKSTLSDIFYYGGQITLKLNKNTLETGVIYTENKVQKTSEQLGYVGYALTFLKNQRINGRIGLSTDDGNNIFAKHNGLGYNFSIYSIIDGFKINVTNNYGNQFYTGANHGKFDLRGILQFPTSLNKFVHFDVIIQNYNSAPFYKDTTGSLKYMKYSNYTLYYTYIFSTTKTLITNFLYEENQTNNYNQTAIENPFKTQGLRIQNGLNIKLREFSSLFTVSVKYGLVRTVSYSNEYFGQTFTELATKPYPVFLFTSSLKGKNYGLIFNYYGGPNSISQQMNYFYQQQNAQLIIVNPYYEKMIFNNTSKVSVNGNFSYNILQQISRLNIYTQITGYTKNNFTVSFLNTLAFQQSTNSMTQVQDRFFSLYFEIMLRKELALRQPRMKFYNLKVIFYKDLNGNRKKDYNEPGVKDVLVEIVRDETADVKSKIEYKGEFYSEELLSNQDGMISYENLPQGTYHIKYHPIGNYQGNFSIDKEDHLIKVNNDQTIYIPFIENNKIFGKVILNRNKLSQLGSIEIGNIRVTATDASGLVTSTLTDRDGNYILYVPNVDEYVVTIKNIFSENFDIQQNNFRVKLNGYKQFEVSFVFNERSRKIIYNNPTKIDTSESDEILTIRQTNLKGTVKDGSNLLPVIVKIEVINKKTKESVTVSSTDREGKYDLTFQSGDDYELVVSNNDYWKIREKIEIDHITSFQIVIKDILLKPIIVGAELPLNFLNFDQYKSDISSQASIELNDLIQLLKDNPSINIEIAGHCDDIEAKTNLKMCEERANKVAKYFREHGFDTKRVTAKGYGDSKPIAPNDERGRPKNRRVEIIISAK